MSLARRIGRTLGHLAGRLAAGVDGLPVVGRLGLPSLRRVFDAVAGVSVVAAVATVAGVTPAWLVRVLAASARPLLGVLGVACVVLVLLGWDRDADDEWTETLREAAPERVPAGDGTPPGAWVTLAAGERDRIAEASLADHYGDAVARDRLIEAATTAVAADTGVDETTAAEQVASGAWTDDPRAAAYLADGETPTVPPGMRLRDWLAGERRPRQVRAAVREIRELAAVGSPVERDTVDATETAASATISEAAGASLTETADSAVDDGTTRSAADDGAVGGVADDGTVDTIADDSAVTETDSGPEAIQRDRDTAETVLAAESVTGVDPETPATDGGRTTDGGDDTSDAAGDTEDDESGSTVRPTGLHATWWEVEP